MTALAAQIAWVRRKLLADRTALSRACRFDRDRKAADAQAGAAALASLTALAAPDATAAQLRTALAYLDAIASTPGTTADDLKGLAEEGRARIFNTGRRAADTARKAAA